MVKNKIIALILFLVIGCSNNNQDNVYSEFPSRWVSDSGSKYQVWFQDWSDYTRLFIKINEDTIMVFPNKYAAVIKGKDYLFPKEYEQVMQKQLIGNIEWINKPIWNQGHKNSFNWLVDRSNPKIKLPVIFKCEATLVDKKKLNLKVFNSENIVFEMNLKPIKIY